MSFDNNGQVRVVPDSEEPSSSSEGTVGLRRLFFVAALGLALALVVVVFQETDPGAKSATAEPPTSSTTVPQGKPLADLVPGFDGTLHAVEESEGFRIISWNSERPMLTARLSEGWPDDLESDAGGRFLGVTVRDRASGAGALFIRDESGMVQMGLEVSSFAWHQTEPGVMAAVSPSEGSDAPDLVTMSLGQAGGSAARVRNVVTMKQGDILLAFDTWGFLIRRQEGASNRILLLDQDGDQVWARPAHWAYASPTGDILLSFYSNESREFRAIRPTTPSTGGGTWFELPSLGVTAVGWSPRAEVAVVTYQGNGAESRLVIFDSGGDLLEELELRWRVWDAEWSGNGRFVIMPGIDDDKHAVLFYDTEEKRLTPVSFEGQILTAIVDS